MIKALNIIILITGPLAVAAMIYEGAPWWCPVITALGVIWQWALICGGTGGRYRRWRCRRRRHRGHHLAIIEEQGHVPLTETVMDLPAFGPTRFVTRLAQAKFRCSGCGVTDIGTFLQSKAEPAPFFNPNNDDA